MAVMYSKLGGWLGVTTKLGPLARTDLWAGVKGLLERLMTHLGLCSSLEDPLGSLLGGSGGVVFPGESTILLGRPGGPMPGRTPKVLPDWPSLIAWLTCLGRTVTFLRGRVSSGLGKTASFLGRKVCSCLGRIASFLGRKVCSCLGRIDSFTRGKVSNCLGDTAYLPGRKVSSGLGGTCLGNTASFPRGKDSAWLTACLG